MGFTLAPKAPLSQWSLNEWMPAPVAAVTFQQKASSSSSKNHRPKYRHNACLWTLSHNNIRKETPENVGFCIITPLQVNHRVPYTALQHSPCPGQCQVWQTPAKPFQHTYCRSSCLLWERVGLPYIDGVERVAEVQAQNMVTTCLARASSKAASSCCVAGVSIAGMTTHLSVTPWPCRA